MKANEIKRLSEREHVLKRTGRYLGSIKAVTQKMFIYKDGKMTYTEVTYVPALMKCVRELIDNSCDEWTRCNGKFANVISVKVDELSGMITVEDNGRGIPCKRLEDGTYQAEAAFTELRAGANFDDDSDNVTIGQNGEGSSLVCILSKLFKVVTADGSKKLTLTCKDNLETKKVDVENCRDNFTKVSFVPDYERFGVRGLDETHIAILMTDLMNLAVAYPDIKFTFNGKKVNSRTFKKYLEEFNETYESLENDNGTLSIGVIPNSEDDFNFVCYVNGVNSYEGGNPMNWAVDNVVNGVFDSISRRYKEMKKGDVRNKLTFVVFFRNMPNPRFDSQTKSRCINIYTDFKEAIGEVDFDKLYKRIARNEVMTGPILDAFRIKEEMKRQAELKNFAKDITKKKLKSAKYMPPINNNKYLMLCEGDSAVGGISAVLGRDGIGYYSMRGVPLNAYDSSTSDLVNNVELKEICQVLGLPIGSKYKNTEVSFKNIVLAQDQDQDGTHISGLILGFFERYAPEVLTNKMVSKLKTPLIVLRKGDKVCEFFFDFNEFNDWQRKHSLNGYQVHYKKGLGSWKKEELKQVIDKIGFDALVEPFERDSETNKYIDDWLSDKKVEARKEYLRHNTFNIQSM